MKMCRSNANIQVEPFIHVGRMWKIGAIRSTVATLQLKFIYRFTSLYDEEKKVIEYLKTIAQKMVLHALEERKTEVSNGMSIDGTKPRVLIDKLLDLEEKGLMDRQRVLDQITTFIAAVSIFYEFVV